MSGNWNEVDFAVLGTTLQFLDCLESIGIPLAYSDIQLFSGAKRIWPI